jgi:ZIP family zinc transporter
MLESIKLVNPVLQALIATLFTWFVTALGAAMVIFFKDIKRGVLNAMLGFAAGVMIAASFWSLLAPALEVAEENGDIAWIPVAAGFLSGGFFLLIVDKILPHLHMGLDTRKAEGIKTSWQRSVLLIMAITLHNIPEGLAVGVAFGAAALKGGDGAFFGAVTLALGIGIQNFPEGAAVSIPLRREGMSRRKSFFYGQMSGIVEPIAGVIGALFVIKMTSLMPFALAFAAGAMIFVCIEELIPEAQRDEKTDLATVGAMLGFTIMMILDVALG